MTAQEFPAGKYRLRIADYLTLTEAGAFEGMRTELIEAEIVVMRPQYRPHGFVKMELYDALRDALRAVQSPLRPVIEVSSALSEHSVPLPDIVLTSEPRGEGLIPLGSIALIVEVADSTLANDLGTKAQIYAAAGVPEYWVADVAGRKIVQLWLPGPNCYGERGEAAFGAGLKSATIAGLAIAIPDAQ